ncbi:uncharacterized protein LOC131435788 isoform X2 [Malaya genurostris]|uniref:uncharacterized protein LOC131435788 isoform X2 n=1 Tax=Malaya genurostris TaxID=325434 RepID=UPI0026F3F9D8|nr:uncharacterized protein LOC131435788 isoform X2 [Malaya genurostris]
MDEEMCLNAEDGEYTEIECLTSEFKREEDVFSVDVTEREETVVRQFIESYKNSEELWDSSHIHYHDQDRRLRALNKLLLIYRKIKPRATHNVVRRKINTLRSHYYKVLRRVEKSKSMATSVADIYQPKSWVFYEMKFLGDLEEHSAKQQNKRTIANRTWTKKRKKMLAEKSPIDSETEICLPMGETIYTQVNPAITITII